MNNFTRPVTRKNAASLLLGGIAVAASFSPLQALAVPAGDTAVPFSGLDVFEIVAHDHDRIHKLLNRLIDDVERRQENLRELSRIFVVHNAMEETYLYPAVAYVAKNKEDSHKLFHDQDEAKVVVWQLSELFTFHPTHIDEFTDRAKDLRTAALEHVKQEETVDFPALRTALGSEGVARVTAQVRSFRAQFS